MVRGELTELYLKQMYPLYFKEYNQKEAMYSKIFDVRPSESAYEKEVQFVGLGDLVERPEGDPISSDNIAQGWTIICKNRTFSRSIWFTKEAVEDSGLDLEKIDLERSGVFISSGIGGIATIEANKQVLDKRGPDRVSPFFLPAALAKRPAPYRSPGFCCQAYRKAPLKALPAPNALTPPRTGKGRTSRSSSRLRIRQPL